MAQPDSRYRVKLQFVVEEIGKEDEEPMFDSGSMTWSGMNYESMTLFEAGMMDAVTGMLKDFGLAGIAEVKRLGGGGGGEKTSGEKKP